MSASVNKVMLIGNLTRDPEPRQLSNGQTVVNFGLAMTRQFLTARGEPREDVCFVDIEAWGRTAETIQQFCRKGNPLYVEGRLRQDRWEDRETGRPRTRLTVVAESIQLLGAPNRDNGGMGGGYGAQQQGGMDGGYGYGRQPMQQQGGNTGRGSYGAPMPAFNPSQEDDTPASPF